MFLLALLLPFASAADPVEVKVDGVSITAAEVDAAAEGLSAYRPEMRPLLVDRLVEIELLNAEARRRKLGKSKSDKLRLAMAQREVMATLAMDAYLDERTTDKDIQAWYDAHRAEYAVTQVRAGHILVATEEEAKSIVSQVQGGASFETLATSLSADSGSAQNGGALGWFGRNQMVPEFEAAAFDNAVGSVVIARTQFGWHVVRVEDRREAIPLDEVKDDIKAQMSEGVLEAWLTELRAKAKIVR